MINPSQRKKKKLDPSKATIHHADQRTTNSSIQNRESGAFDRRATRWQIYPCSVEMGAGPSSSYYPQLHGVRKQIEGEREISQAVGH